MSQLPFTFDANQVKPQGDRTPVPAGTYNVILKSSEIKPTEDKTGSYIQGAWEIVEGEHKGRQIFNNINLVNKNEVATRIGHERLSALCHVLGRLQINDTAQLHGLPHQIKVSVSADNKYNEITGFLTADGRSPTGGGAPGAPAGPPGPPPAPPAPQYQQPAPQPQYQQPAPPPPQQPVYQPPAQPVYQQPPAQQPAYQPPVQQPQQQYQPTPQQAPAPAPAPQPQYAPPVGAPPPAGMPAAPAGLPAWMQNQQPAPAPQQ